MRRIDRFNLTDLIGRKLQSQMSYADIDVYFRAFGINVDGKKTSVVNSKWVYTKEVLADEPDATILAIAEELKIDHPYHGPKRQDVSDSRFWLPGHFRLFLSHLSSFKTETALLQSSLRPMGIAAFVAHQDIEPTKEWLNEIEKALFSMDALAAILTPGFHESNWTDHEVGIAVGRDVLVIPVRRGLDPYGFIGKYQGFQATGKTVKQVAEGLFSVIIRNTKTEGRMLDCLVEQLLLAGNDEDALSRIELLQKAESFPEKHAEKIRESFSANNKLAKSQIVFEAINALFAKSSLAQLSCPIANQGSTEDTPF